MARLNEEPGFIESFVQAISTSYPDMFRDPELWIALREQILPGLATDSATTGIHMPDSVSAEEIYSMAILLKESGLNRQIKLTATCTNDLIREQIENGPLSRGHYKNGQDNYLVYNPGSTLDKYFLQRNGKHYLQSGLLEPLKLVVRPEGQNDRELRSKLIFYRNRMIYLTRETSQRRLGKMIDQAVKGTIFVIGIKESLKYLGLTNKVHIISADLNIFSKAG
jgi:chemotaxis protein methyltransferase CheR